MRKLIVCNIVSLDGYYAGPGGHVMALPFDDGFDDYNAERLRAADTLLLGRTSYEGFKSYWPSIADNDKAPAVEREVSRLNNTIDKVVVSDSLTPDDTGPVPRHSYRRPCRRPPRDQPAEEWAGPRDPDVRQPHPVERPARPRSRRRTAFDDRRRRAGRNPSVRAPAARIAATHRRLLARYAVQPTT